MFNRHKFLIGVILGCGTIFSAPADQVEVFSGASFPAGWQPQRGSWKYVAKTGGKLTLTDFADSNVAGKKRYSYSVVKNIDPISGNFTVEWYLSYDQRDAAFVGSAVITLLDRSGKPMALAGLMDSRNFAPAAYYFESGKNKNGKYAAPLKADDKFVISRSGKVLNFFIGSRQIMVCEAPAGDLAGIKLGFDWVKVPADARGAASHFADFTPDKLVIKNTAAAELAPGLQERFSGGKFSSDWYELPGSVPLTLGNGKHLQITGFDPAVTGKSEKAAFKHIRERCFGRLDGDFNLQFDLAWDQIDRAFCGAFELRLLDVNGNVLVRFGLDDPWNGIKSRLIAACGKQKFVSFASIAGEGRFTVVRKGGKYRLAIRNWLLLETEGPVVPVDKVQLVWLWNKKPQEKNDKTWAMATHFLTLTLKELTVQAGAPEALTAPIPPPPEAPATEWKLDKPIISYWAGPPISEKMARQLAEGGYTVGWAEDIFDLDILHKYGLKAFAVYPHRVKVPITPEEEINYRNWVNSIKDHPALFMYHCGDEMHVTRKQRFAQMVALAAKYDPTHPTFNNMYPFGVSHKDLGLPDIKGVKELYFAHLEDARKLCNLKVLSYDLYHFGNTGDAAGFFFNQAMAREKALEWNVPMFNIVQGCRWRANLRAPSEHEYRYLGYVSLAYGSKGLSPYVYGWKGHQDAMVEPVSGEPLKLYYGAIRTHKEFVAIGSELMDLPSLAVYHAGDIPVGGVALPGNAKFTLHPAIVSTSRHDSLECYSEGNWVAPQQFALYLPVKGFLLGYFGKDQEPSHVLVVNLDYKETRSTTLVAPGAMERFDPSKCTWSDAGQQRIALTIEPGGGVLLRMKK